MRKETKEIRIQHSFSFGTCHCNSCFTSAKVNLEIKRDAIKFNHPKNLSLDSILLTSKNDP